MKIGFTNHFTRYCTKQGIGLVGVSFISVTVSLKFHVLLGRSSLNLHEQIASQDASLSGL